MEVGGSTVGEALAEVFARTPSARGYILDDQGGVRKHVSVFVDGVQIRDRQKQSDSVTTDSEIWIRQALSGG